MQVFTNEEGEKMNLKAHLNSDLNEFKLKSIIGTDIQGISADQSISEGITPNKIVKI